MKADDWMQILNANKLIRSPHEAMAFEYALAELARNPKPEDLPKLHLVLDDRCQQPDVIFSLIHFLESFDLEEQLIAFIQVVPKLFAVAPNWTELLHTRILNDTTAGRSYQEKLQAMNDRHPHLIREWLEESATSHLSDRG
jgi:Immunity protein 30